MSSPLLLLFLILPLSVSGRIFGVPTMGMNVRISGNSVSYFPSIRLNLSSTDIETDARFLIDTNANIVTLSSNSCTTAQTTKHRATGLWSFITGQGGFTASTADMFLGNVGVLCRRNTTNVAALGHASTALPAQLSKVGQISFRFAYTVRNDSGLLLFGKDQWVQFVSTVPTVTAPVTFTRLALKMDAGAAASYMVKLTGIGFQSVSSGQSEYVAISVTQRYITLPSKMYTSVLNQFQQEASQKKIKSAATSFGKLTRCYQMTSSVKAGLHNLTMVFDGTSRWIVPGDKYLVHKTGANDVFCLAFLEAAAGSYGVIGTLPQEDRAIDYNLQNRTLGVSPPLIGSLFSP